VKFGGRPWQRQVRAVIARDRVCWSCGHPAETADHVIPRARGGSNETSNLRGACHGCNRRRGAKPVSEFLAVRRREARTIFGRGPADSPWPAMLRGDFTARIR
jgi:5-methylcytosine-specific restriction endonuclease McrA